MQTISWGYWWDGPPSPNRYPPPPSLREGVSERERDAEWVRVQSRGCSSGVAETATETETMCVCAAGLQLNGVLPQTWIMVPTAWIACTYSFGWYGFM